MRCYPIADADGPLLIHRRRQMDGTTILTPRLISEGVLWLDPLGGASAAYVSKCMPAAFAAFSSKVIVRAQFAR